MAIEKIKILGADYSFEVKNIEIWVPPFFKHNNSLVDKVTWDIQLCQSP